MVIGILVFIYFPLTPPLPSPLTERITQTVSIDATTVDIEEKGVKLRLTVVDTPGFGDAVNNEKWYQLLAV